MKILILLSIIVALQNAHADIDRKGNGGDLCEDRIKLIRDDLTSWVAKGGARGLNLPGSVRVEDYVTKMKLAFRLAKISCTSTTVVVNRMEKTCRNFIDPRGQPQISCNLQRFTEIPESDQYVLVHHEFAGLAGFEKNSEDGSIYQISNQISGYLIDEVVKKLAVHPPTPKIESGKPLFPQLKALFEQNRIPYNLDAISIQKPDQKSYFNGCAQAGAAHTQNLGSLVVVNFEVSVTPDGGPLSPGKANRYPTLQDTNWVTSLISDGAIFRNGALNIDAIEFGPACLDGSTSLQYKRNIRAGFSSDLSSYNVVHQCPDGQIVRTMKFRRAGGFLIQQQTEGGSEEYTYCW